MRFAATKLTAGGKSALGLFLWRTVIVLCLPCVCFAETRKGAAPPPAAIFDQLKEEYLRLRNTDIDVAQVPRWEELAAEFDRFVARYPGDVGAPFALLYNSVLYEQLFRRFGGEDRIKKSADYLARLVAAYPKDSLADDALIRRGDILLYDLDQPEEAKAAYRIVWEKYRDGDMRDVAAARLRSIESGEHATFLSALESEQAKTAKEERKGRTALVVLDPGHGGEDFGAKGQGGLLEKDVTLAMAFAIEKLLLQDKGVAVRLTRRKDVFVPLAERIQFANDYEADLFVSLHTNASPAAKLSGLETYYLDNDGDEASRLLVERENSAGTGMRGSANGDLQFMLGDLIQNGKLEESIVLANLLQRSLVNRLRGRYDFIHDLGVKKAPFYVLVGAHMPCVLVETFFIDHGRDGVNLASREFRRQVAEGLTQGISAFLERVQPR